MWSAVAAENNFVNDQWIIIDQPSIRNRTSDAPPKLNPRISRHTKKEKNKSRHANADSIIRVETMCYACNKNADGRIDCYSESGLTAFPPPEYRYLITRQNGEC